MKMTPFVSGGGVGVGASDVGGGVEVDVWPPVADGVGLGGEAAVPESEKPLARTARPTTISATVTRTRPVLRFTRASYLPCLTCRARAEPAVLQGDTEPLRGPALAPQRAKPAEPPDQHRVIRERGGAVDRPVQQLVVSRRREPEGLADRPILRDLQSPGSALEVQHTTLEVIKDLRGCCRCWGGGRQRRSARGGGCSHGSGRLASVVAPCKHPRRTLASFLRATSGESMRPVTDARW